MIPCLPGTHQEVGEVMSHDRSGLEPTQRGHYRVGGQFPCSVQSPERGQDLGIEMSWTVQLVTAHPGSHRAPEL